MSKLNYLTKYFFLLFLFFLIILNLFSLHQNQIIYSFSKGDKYYRNLQKWYYYAQKEKWDKALKLEKKLDYKDLSLFKQNNQIDFLKDNLQDLLSQENKNADDWVKIAQINAKIGQELEAFNAISAAKEMDPLRSDIEELYFKLLPSFR